MASASRVAVSTHICGLWHTLRQPARSAAAPCRPYNQGARLTAYELVTESIPATLIADSAAAALLATKRADAVVVGADRVAANGDTANKVGTCMLAAAAAAYGIPFFIAAPTTSIDPAIPSGEGIEIEERAANELTHERSSGAHVAAEGIGVWNPAFDVAPARHITGAATLQHLQWLRRQLQAIALLTTHLTLIRNLL